MSPTPITQASGATQAFADALDTIRDLTARFKQLEQERDQLRMALFSISPSACNEPEFPDVLSTQKLICLATGDVQQLLVICDDKESGKAEAGFADFEAKRLRELAIEPMLPLDSDRALLLRVANLVAGPDPR